MMPFFYDPSEYTTTPSFRQPYFATPRMSFAPFGGENYASSSTEDYYRRVAEDHERRARAALALAQEEEARRRVAAAEFANYHHPPAYYSHDDLLSTRRYHSAEQRLRDEREREIEAWLERRRQREREEEEHRRRADAQKRAEDNALKALLSAFGVDSYERRAPEPESEQASYPFNPRIQQHHDFLQPERRKTPVAEAQPEPEDIASHLWTALSAGRTDDEKASILQELGLAAPKQQPRAAPVKATTPKPTTPRPAERQQQSALPFFVFNPPAPVHRPAPKPAPTPKTTTKPAPITTSTPVNAPTPKPASPTPKLTPFGHIELIQNKFDDLRGQPGNAKALEALLVELDKVESSGSEAVRGARKALVIAVEAELDALEKHVEKPVEVGEKEAEEKTVEVEVEDDAAMDFAPVEEDLNETTQVFVPEEQPTHLEDVADPVPTSEHPEEPVITSAPTSKPAASIASPVISEPVSVTVSEARPASPESVHVRVEPDIAVASRHVEEDTVRGRDKTKANSTPAPRPASGSRPRSVIVEEVPDEGDDYERL